MVYNIEDKINAIAALLIASTPEEQKAARDNLSVIIGEGCSSAGNNPEICIRSVLLDAGSPEHLLGSDYMVKAILLCLEDKSCIKYITTKIYPRVAEEFNTTPSRVERALRHLITVTFTRGDPDVLFRYFGNSVDFLKGKPTNGEFIARITNVVKERLS